LHADRLVFDFPNLAPTDLPIVRQILVAVHDAFPKAFLELDYERAEVQSYEHLDLMDEAKVRELLSAYEMQSVSRVFGEGRVIQRPAAKVELLSEDQRWQATCSIERSLLRPSAVFFVMLISLRKLSPQSPYEEKATLAREVSKSCQAVFGIEVED